MVAVPAAGLAAGEAAAPEDWTTSKLSEPFAEPGATGAEGSAAAGEPAGAGELVCAVERVRVPSNAAAAQLNCFSGLDIYMGIGG